MPPATCNIAGSSLAATPIDVTKWDLDKKHLK